MSAPNPYFNAKPYVPTSLSEIYDMLGSMLLFAPTFIDPTGTFSERNVENEFATLVEAFGLVRKKLGEERYAKLVDLAASAKTLFAEDQDDTNGKTDQGRALLYEIEDIITEVSRRRVKARQLDDEGEITGD